MASKFKVIHATNIHIQHVFNYNNCRLLNRSQTYDGKMAAKKIKYVKRMKASMKACKVDDKDHIMVLRFIA